GGHAGPGSGSACPPHVGGATPCLCAPGGFRPRPGGRRGAGPARPSARARKRRARSDRRLVLTLGYRFETFENRAPVLLRHGVRFFLAGVVVLLESEDGLAPSLGKLVGDRVVILRLVCAATHRAPVCGLEQLLRFDRQDRSRVLLRLALPLAC